MTSVSVQASRQYIGQQVLVPSTGEFETLKEVKRVPGFKSLSGKKFPDHYTLTFETRWVSLEDTEKITVQ